MHRSLKRAAWALPALLIVVLSGCGSDSDANVGEEPTLELTGQGPAQPTVEEIVRAVEVGPDDLPDEFGAEEFGERGDRVDGYVTLDMCGAAFPSEDLRTARHQVGYSAPDGDAISSETVAYELGGAEQAMGELRDAIVNCPTGFVGSSVAGQPRFKTQIGALPADADWQEDTLAIRVTLMPKNGPSFSGVSIYQRRGDVITAVYVWAGRERSAELAAPLASMLGVRLEAADPIAETAS